MLLDEKPYALILIDIRRVSKSNIVEVAFTGEDPETAARFVNDLLDHHIARIASLGEGTGAALAMGIMEGAVRIFKEMLTFEEAGVSNKE